MTPSSPSLQTGVPKSRYRLLCGASALALASLGLQTVAQAQSIAALHAGANLPTVVTPTPTPLVGGTPAVTPGMQAAQALAMRSQVRAASDMDLASQAQAAARAAAQALTSSVPNGLQVGGLVPVANPTLSANDPTGLRTWQGASAPRQTVSGSAVEVTIDQSDPRAVLSWQTFNVGQQTTLVFNQTKDGVAQTDWVALNRVVGQINPSTGLVDSSQAPAPSRILGSIRADGTVLVINPSGIIFSPTSQINVRAFMATSLDVGRSGITPSSSGVSGTPLTIQDRNQAFLATGLLGSGTTFSALANAQGYDQRRPGDVIVEQGARIVAAEGGLVILVAPRLTNAGYLSATNGQVSLVSGGQVTFARSEGTTTGAGSNDPNVRGLIATGVSEALRFDGNTHLAIRDPDYVRNTGLISSTRGYLSMQSTGQGAVLQQGVLSATTSVSRNGFIRLDGGDVSIAPRAGIFILPDSLKDSIPQATDSVAAFKTSKILIGGASSRIEIGASAMIYAPSADVGIGASGGEGTLEGLGLSRIFIDDGAVIDVSGLKDVLVLASRNLVTIDPTKRNELRDSPTYRDAKSEFAFLNGASVTVDGRLSGVRSDGVAWVGSPLIEAGSYYAQIGIGVEELLVTGGNVTLGVASYSAGDINLAPELVVKSGATIDVSGGWRRFEAGEVVTSRLITSDGALVDIGSADPNGSYVGLYRGDVETQDRWGITRVYTDPLLLGTRREAEYVEGQDAGSLTLKGSIIAFDGKLKGEAFAGQRQLLAAQKGSASSSVFADQRKLQATPAQLPNNAFLFVQAKGTGETAPSGGGNIRIVSASEFTALPATIRYKSPVSLDASGNLVRSSATSDASLDLLRRDQILLNAEAINGYGLSQLSLRTTGEISQASGSDLHLADGSILSLLAGRQINLNGQITAHSGTIEARTANFGISSVTQPTALGVGVFDINVRGTLDTSGLWVNDFNAPVGGLQGKASIAGGNVYLTAAASQLLNIEVKSVSLALATSGSQVNQDISGSIRILSGAAINASGGGYLSPTEVLDLTARGGNVGLVQETVFFEGVTDEDGLGSVPFRLSGFRVSNKGFVAENPDQITAVVLIADGAIRAHGFAGGGTFTLTTPKLAFDSSSDPGATVLGLDFFSKSGFAKYDLTSYATAFVQNQFDNGLGGYHAALAMQTVEVGPDKSLLLTQSQFSPLLDLAQLSGLRALGTGQSLYSLLTPIVPVSTWDQRALSLKLGGALELHVAERGSILGAPGASLTVGKLYNEGNIRLAGGTVTQELILPGMYLVRPGDQNNFTVGLHSFGDLLAGPADLARETDANGLGLSADGIVLTNAEILDGTRGVYLLGQLDQFEGVRLGAHSRIDLSGQVVFNPRATGGSTAIIDGRVVAGGSLATASVDILTGRKIFASIGGLGSSAPGVFAEGIAQRGGFGLQALAGASLDLSGKVGTFDRLTSSGLYAATPVWSDGGTLKLGDDYSLAGLSIRADGGESRALGGTLSLLDPTLVDATTTLGGLRAFAAQTIESAGFDTLVVQGNLKTVGDIDLKLSQGFFLVSRGRETNSANLSTIDSRFSLVPILSLGGDLTIDAPYFSFLSSVQTLKSPNLGTLGSHSLILRGQTAMVQGAVVFDQSVASTRFDLAGDLRLSGVRPWQQQFSLSLDTLSDAEIGLRGGLAVNGDLTITAGQIYPTTGSQFTLTSAGTDALIQIRSSANPIQRPYSAGGSLLIQAAHLVQGGIVRAPFGKLTLGGTSEARSTALGSNGLTQDMGTLAPATLTLEVSSGSETAVASGGINIPYGTTTDQIEWFFEPGGSSALVAPPTGVLKFAGRNIDLKAGAKLDISGGGDLYAYEFVSGVGGSRDVLDRQNQDSFSANNGFQYPDQRQVYAIVPGVSADNAALLDPIYSADYADLYSSSALGKKIYLDSVPGLSAGRYTLLPAKYAMLPGGLRVVEQTNLKTAQPGALTTLLDGSYIVTGQLGQGGSQEAGYRSFQVQTQSVFRTYSNIITTSAAARFAAIAKRNGVEAPRLPNDAQRLILEAVENLAIGSALTATAGPNGRGSQVDIAGQAFAIVSAGSAPTAAGVIRLNAGDLTKLGAASLLVGGIRTDNVDGTTTLQASARSITVDSSATNPLSAAEVLLLTDGDGGSITLNDGAVITAKGTAPTSQAGNYLLDGALSGQSAQGAFVRVAVGQERGLTRSNIDRTGNLGQLSVGKVNLSGDSIVLDSAGTSAIDDQANLASKAISLGADRVTFAEDPTGLTGLIIGSRLRTLVTSAKSLTIQGVQSIAFDAGTYEFGDLTLNTQRISVLDNGEVSLSADHLSLQNSRPAVAGCIVSSVSCGTGSLNIASEETTFDGGTLAVFGAGNGVGLSAVHGLFVQAPTSGLNVGASNLTLTTPIIADRSLTDLAPGEKALSPGLTLTSALNFRVLSGGFAKPWVQGVPGASVALVGDSLSISGTTLRSTAGTLSLTSRSDLTVAGGAALEVPAYAKSFGTSTDATLVSAPGGTLSLTSSAGSVLARADSKIVLGGPTGKAGSLKVSAFATLGLNSQIDVTAPEGQADLTLDTGGSFDLSGFIHGLARTFNGDISVRSGTGDLTLVSSDQLAARSVKLVADGGKLIVAGSIDTSGVEGGDITLFGRSIQLDGTAKLDASADGYAADDSRQAQGGDILLGIGGAGSIDVASGALIDVSARSPGNRLVAVDRSGAPAWTLAEGDTGGRLLFRSPVITRGGNQDVAVNFAGSVSGAREVSVEAYKSFDLADVAANANWAGVTINASGDAVIDVSDQSRVNFFADRGTGTLVEYIQDFNLSAAASHLGGLASRTDYHARPGVELTYSGTISLNSTWNLGAGEVRIEDAVRDGLMVPIADRPGKFSVVAGREADLFSFYTRLVYRTGASASGEAGVLTFRAGGDLNLNDSLTDGFFQFRDQTDPVYLNYASGYGGHRFTPTIGYDCNPTSDCSVVSTVDFTFPSRIAFLTTPDQNVVVDQLKSNIAPYSIEANRPWAAGSIVGGKGDPLASAELMPLVKLADSREVASQSWSYRLVAGSNLAGESVDPGRILAGVTASIRVWGQREYSVYVPPTFDGQFWVHDTEFDPDLESGDESLPASAWLTRFLARNSAKSSSQTNSFIDFSVATGVPASVRTELSGLAQAFFASHPGQSTLVGRPGRYTGVATKLGLAVQFLDFVSANASRFVSAYSLPTASGDAGDLRTTAVGATFWEKTLVRTGAGSISMVAPTDVDLRGGASAIFRDRAGIAGAQSDFRVRTGGSAVYTAGVRAQLTPVIATTAGGQSLTVTPQITGADPTGFVDPTSVNSALADGDYQYGGVFYDIEAGGGFEPVAQGSGVQNILIGNPLYARGGGDLAVAAGRDILGQRSVWAEITAPHFSWIGTSDQLWATGSIGTNTDIRVNPQLFTSGLGTLGGGNIRVEAGRDASDLTVAATSARSTASSSDSGRALITFGGGNVDVSAGRNIVGNRIDIASGVAKISAGQDIDDAARVNVAFDVGSTSFSLSFRDNPTRLRLADADLNLTAGRNVALQGIAALGVRNGSSEPTNDLNSAGFYSARSSVAISALGSLTVDNQGAELLARSTTSLAVYPGKVRFAALLGDMTISTRNSTPLVNSDTGLSAAIAGSPVVLMPTFDGQLEIFAGQDLDPVIINMDDGDPALMPGLFSPLRFDISDLVEGRNFELPIVQPTTSDLIKRLQHRREALHEGDTSPNIISVGNDISRLTLFTPKQTRIAAGRDIVDMMFFGQNLATGDVTRVSAGRDIIATTVLESALTPSRTFTRAKPALQGNSFVIGGPGTFYLEAGRDAGPFLNSAITNGLTQNSQAALGIQTYGGGILSVGNLRNPWLPEGGANVVAAFGVAGGTDFAALRDVYLDPAHLADLAGDLFEQITDSNGAKTPDRGRPIYGPILVEWMASKYSAQLLEKYGTTAVSSAQAYAEFKSLPEISQRDLLLRVYFNELTQSAAPDGASFKQYSRGYKAVSLLFPGDLGYRDIRFEKDTVNGSEVTVTKFGADQDNGNLDLRLATIQTQQGGDVFLLGPGGRALLGSTTRTSEQAARRSYSGGRLNAAGTGDYPATAEISAIPVGLEGVLTYSGGGIYSFTDGDLLLNQSRLFTLGAGADTSRADLGVGARTQARLFEGGNSSIALWSSKAGVNAGQGPKSTTNSPPVVVKIDENATVQLEPTGSVSGAGIGAFKIANDQSDPDVFLIAPEGTVDAGDAGVRVSGNIVVAAASVANADNFKVSGDAIGVPAVAAVDVGAASSANAAAASAQQAAQQAARSSSARDPRTIISVEVLGYVGGDGEDEEQRRRRQRGN